MDIFTVGYVSINGKYETEKMITNIQREFLEKLNRGEIHKRDNPKKYSMMIINIQKQIDKNLENLIWLIEDCPNIFTDADAEIDNPKLERYRRFRALAYIITKIDPSVELEKLALPDILKKLSQIYPSYYFEIIKKKR
jgi:hypothetical protein